MLGRFSHRWHPFALDHSLYAKRMISNLSIVPGKSQKKDQEQRKECKPEGLCANCINLRFCSYAKRAINPVLFCEEYDIYQRLAEKYDLDVDEESEE